MFDAFRKLFADLTEDDKQPHRFADNDYRLAAVALLIHTAAIDGVIAQSERDRLRAVIKQRFHLDDETVDALIVEATEAEQQAIDLYQFTSRLNRTLDEEGRARVVEMMWKIVFADGAATEFEENLVWRAADLLHVPGEERIALRRRVSGTAEENESPQ